ncbi:MAG: 16S rRNA (cytosine(1402)-N(4))-methyltransferase RsmH [Alphaproteobacteria bacterium]|nr:16S rRNA (cytosine(1402)-N(4))-methyltransferase RsmH [Alphaproteobacteria bacterium]
MSTTVHKPVMVVEVLAALAPRDGGVYVDGTFGGGGWSRAILAQANCTVCGLDRDGDAIAAGASLARSSGGRLKLIQSRFGAMREALAAEGIASVDGVALDLGLSSDQLGAAERGFSFAQDGPLDMRMDRHGPSAADVVNEREPRELAQIIADLGEEPKARRIARAIANARALARITRTAELADIVRRAIGGTWRAIDPATRTFQALRIYVNDELDELDRGLVAAEAVLRPGGRLVVVSFHSLEDRRVKTFLRVRAEAGAAGSRHLPATEASRRPSSFRLLTRKAIRPSDEEIATNPRARSAKLRAAERTTAPTWGAMEEAA